VRLSRIGDDFGGYCAHYGEAGSPEPRCNVVATVHRALRVWTRRPSGACNAAWISSATSWRSSWNSAPYSPAPRRPWRTLRDHGFGADRVHRRYRRCQTSTGSPWHG